MDAKCQDNRHVLNSLYLKLKDYQSIFLTVEDLKLLGVEASRVGIFNEQLQFDPCFFRPHPERVLHKYPLGRNDIERLDSPPTLYDFLNEAKKFSTDEKEQLTIAKSSHKAHYEDSTHCGCDSIALDAYEHVDSHLTRPRRRNPDDEKFRDWFHLESLTDFEYFDWEKGLKKGDPLPIQISPRDMYWVVKSAYRPWDNGNRAKPHCIINVLSTAYASEEDQSLTLHELKAIVNVMLPPSGSWPIPYSRYPSPFAHFIQWV
ncbi:hypothetical protein N7519_007657 [Penicillium mononematosum]|uniref:uncharacterized protein n=1 Tax=Penicillium mononematosum TaxID=268346 RepID=UPI002548D936|nr:uncharacterized protein N7519_007657 [Penicillium mononematosum]KAJ6186356.1 hypothetical protein N7519_007657 [Penicillium mononematosum]